MNSDRDPTQLVRAWLEQGVTALPDRVLDSVLDELPRTQQHRRWWTTGRSVFMPDGLKFAIATGAIALALVVGLGAYFGRTQNIGAPPLETPATSPSHPAETAAAPTRSPAGTEAPSPVVAATSTTALPTLAAPSASTGWRPGAPMPAAYANATLAGVVDGEVWMVHRLGFRDRPAEITVLTYDIVADEWTNRGQITYDSSNGDFSGPAAVDSDGTLYVFGHAREDGARVAVGFDARVSLDATDAGSTPIGIGLGFQGTPLLGPDGRFYLLEVTFEDEYQGPSRLVSYDPATDEWAEPPAIPTPRVAPVLAADRNGGVLVVGGRTPERETGPDTTETDPIAAIERLDTETGEWSTGVPLPDSIAVGADPYDVAVVAPDGTLIVYGGLSYPGPMLLEQGATEWRGAPFSPTGLLPTGATFLPDGTLIVFGLLNDGTGAFVEPMTWISDLWKVD